LADSEKVFCCWIQIFNKQVGVDNDDARTQAVDDTVALRRSSTTIGFFLAGVICVRG